MLESGSYALNSTKGDRERIGRLLRMHANHREEIDRWRAGDICAIIGLKGYLHGRHALRSGESDHPRIDHFPEPVISVSIEPKTRADQDKMGNALSRLAEEDPTFRVRTNEETGQTLIDGMGELHLEVIVDRMMREFRVEANVGRPQVAYKETITCRSGPKAGTFVRPAAHGQYGHAVRRIRAAGAGRRLRVRRQDRRRLDSARIHRRRSTRASARRCDRAARPAIPIVDIKATLVDGSYHDVDSKEVAYKIAGSLALKEAVRRGKPVVLEPIMGVEVVTPDEFMGDVIGDLNSRRGQIQGMEIRAGAQVIRAFVPLSQMFGYATDLRSATQGRAVYSMQFDHYAPVPANLAEEMVAKNAPGLAQTGSWTEPGGQRTGVLIETEPPERRQGANGDVAQAEI